MHGFLGALGGINLASGVLLLVAPHTAKQIMEARQEFTRLSPNALRVLGGWFGLMGLTLIGAALTPTLTTRHVELPTEEHDRVA